MNFLNKETNFAKDILVNISKYSHGEIIITDKNFNIFFQNACEYKGKYNFLNINENFFNKKFSNNLIKFKFSDKNHLFIKMIFNDDKNLNNIPVDVHICKLFDKNNNLYGFIILIQDITEELRNKIQRETFIDIISHDLRNPMRANIQILELVLKNKFGYIENNLKVVIEELLNSCRYMNYMAENLVIKYKNEINISELLKEQYSIVKLIKDKCIKLNSITEKKHQTIELSIKDNIKDVSIDIDLIGKIINNIIINASEQSKEYSKIFINVENNKNNVEIYFIYNSGKNKKITEDVFDEYINCSNRFRKIGFGLEFYNCKKIIEAHNGIIIAENGSSTNTKIKITLPAIISE